MVTKKFLLVLKTSNGGVFVSNVLDSVSELKDDFIRFEALGVSVLDLISVEVDLSKYEH